MCSPDKNGENKPLNLTVRAVYGRHLPAQDPSLDQKKLPSKHVFERRRLDTHTTSDDPSRPSGPDKAFFEPGQGLVGHDMYHTDYFSRKYCYEERAVLLQSMENYFALVDDEKVGSYFHMYQAPTRAEQEEKVLAQPNFGEQLIVEGCDASQLCIGDVFEVPGSTLKLEVTSPRLPCYAVDQKFESPFGAKGVKRRTMDLAAAGWFCRVLEKGQLKDGMRIVRVSQPHPQWTLTRAATALYGNKANRVRYLGGKSSWSETIETLREFVELPQLGDYEWRWEAEELLEEMEEQIREDEAETKAMFEAESWCSAPFGDTAAAIGACACMSPVVLGMLFNWNSIF